MHFLQGGTNPIDFEPKGLFVTQRLQDGSWSDIQVPHQDLTVSIVSNILAKMGRKNGK